MCRSKLAIGISFLSFRSYIAAYRYESLSPRQVHVGRLVEVCSTLTSSRFSCVSGASQSVHAGSASWSMVLMS